MSGVGTREVLDRADSGGAGQGLRVNTCMCISEWVSMITASLLVTCSPTPHTLALDPPHIT
jgi:hypothetical protein